MDGEHHYGKSHDGFHRLGTSLEPATPDLGLDRTPIDRFFVCSAGPAPTVDPETWRLRIDGDAAATAADVSLADLRSLPQVTVVAWLECAGNGRRLFDMVAGQPVPEHVNHTRWMLGALGLATWTGPRLSDVLDLAGRTAEAAWVGPTGLDHDNVEGEPIRMSMPMDKALDPDTIVALTMNDQELGPAHGAPARLVVPGWVGAYSVKWLERLEISERWIDSFRASEYYVLRDAEGNPTGPATAHPPKSQLALGWGTAVVPGRHAFTGYARSGLAPIETVEWALDDGPWQPADLLEDLGRWAWRPFHLAVDLTPGTHTIRTRATDASGNTQPAVQPPHRDGVLWHAVIPHPVVAQEDR